MGHRLTQRYNDKKKQEGKVPWLTDVQCARLAHKLQAIRVLYDTGKPIRDIYTQAGVSSRTFKAIINHYGWTR